ncbi:MAG: muconolactone Delta-isomerase [Acidimicrobiales bacterium]
MEFLARITTNLPADMDESARAALLAEEAAAGRTLMEAGTLKRIWRVPGHFANVSLWEVPDATALHAAISSLPLWNWQAVDVTPLAVHPLEGERA